RFEVVIRVWREIALVGSDTKKPNSGTADSFSPQANHRSQPPQLGLNAEPQGPPMHVDQVRAMQYVKEIVAFGPRWPGSKGQEKVAGYLRNKLKADHLEEDAFTGDTPAGKLPM